MKLFRIAIYLFALYGMNCKIVDLEVDQTNKQLFNSMSVSLNGKYYTLTDVRGYKDQINASAPHCEGTLLGKKLWLSFKNGVTVPVGYQYEIRSGVYIKYTGTYGSYNTIDRSGIISSESFLLDGATRFRGSYNFKAVYGNDTLIFANGHFDVSLQ